MSVAPEKQLLVSTLANAFRKQKALSLQKLTLFQTESQDEKPVRCYDQSCEAALILTSFVDKKRQALLCFSFTLLQLNKQSAKESAPIFGKIQSGTTRRTFFTTITQSDASPSKRMDTHPVILQNEVSFEQQINVKPPMEASNCLKKLLNRVKIVNSASQTNLLTNYNRSQQLQSRIKTQMQESQNQHMTFYFPKTHRNTYAVEELYTHRRMQTQRASQCRLQILQKLNQLQGKLLQLEQPPSVRELNSYRYVNNDYQQNSPSETNSYKHMWDWKVPSGSDASSYKQKSNEWKPQFASEANSNKNSRFQWRPPTGSETSSHRNMRKDVQEWRRIMNKQKKRQTTFL